MTAAVLVACGGAFGALLRLLLTRADGEVPWRLIVVNVAASALAALASGLEGRLVWLVSVGFLGALSTWSSLAVTVVDRWQRGRRAVSAATLVVTMAASVMVVAVIKAL